MVNVVIPGALRLLLTLGLCCVQASAPEGDSSVKDEVVIPADILDRGTNLSLPAKTLHLEQIDG